MYTFRVFYNQKRDELLGFILFRDDVSVISATLLPSFIKKDITTSDYNEFKSREEANLAFLAFRDRLKQFIRPGGLHDLTDYETEELSYKIASGDIFITTAPLEPSFDF